MNHLLAIAKRHSSRPRGPQREPLHPGLAETSTEALQVSVLESLRYRPGKMSSATIVPPLGVASAPRSALTL